MLRLNKRFILFSIILFILASVIFAMPVMAFAQEEETVGEEEVVEPDPETLIFDINYQDLSGDGTVGATFVFRMDVTFDGEEARLFEFINEIPGGWTVAVNSGATSSDITKIKLQPLKKEVIKVIISALVPQEPGEYDINIILKPIEGSETPEAKASFTAIVKPTGKLQFQPASGMFSAAINSTSDNIYKLTLENIGTSPVEDITLVSGNEPEGWLLEFENEIDIIEVGEKKEIDISISPSEKTIAGDYDIRFRADSEKSSNSFLVRFTVVTPLIWKIVGIGLIVIVVIGIAFIFARLGKR